MTENLSTQVPGGNAKSTGIRMGKWFFLYIEMIIFGGLLLAFSIFRFNNQEAFHIAANELNLMIGSLNTAILLTSCLTMVLALAAIQKNNKKLSMFFQLITVILALVFLVNRVMECSYLQAVGLYSGSELLSTKGEGENLFFGLYRLISRLHLLNVVIGVILIIVTMIKTKQGKISKLNYSKLDRTSLAWNVISIIWIFFFPIFYIIV